MLGATMRARALALALALLLLLTQQFGVQHALWHGRGLGGTGGVGRAAAVSAGLAPGGFAVANRPSTRLSLATPAPTATSAGRAGAASAAAPAPPGDQESPADSLCPVCLLLATLAAALLPAALRWCAAAVQRSAPVQRAQPAPIGRRAAHYQARAPPALLALT